MRVVITRRASRNQLACVRQDGTSAVADLGPHLPYHDLAHWVVEQRFDLRDGFFGHVARGYTPAELSDKNVIMSLGKEPYRAEILARALGSLHTGACDPEQYEDLVNTELAGLGLSWMRISPLLVAGMADEYRGLVQAYDSLCDGESLELHSSRIACRDPDGGVAGNCRGAKGAILRDSPRGHPLAGLGGRRWNRP